MVLFKAKTRILFVCTENVCRSPIAEGLMRHYLRISGKSRGVRVSSAGTVATRPGARPDLRAQRVARAKGIDLSRIRASKLTQKELKKCDHIFAMDCQNLQKILDICEPPDQHKVSLLLAHVPLEQLDEVPDPYYGSYQGFVDVFGLLEKAVIELVANGIELPGELSREQEGRESA